MNCIIVDDDKLARAALKQLIEKVNFLKLKEECSDAVAAFNLLKKESIDLVFLDVEMPGMNGLELIKNLQKRPMIILITSNENYAVEAFELSVTDFIVKPVTLSRFMAVVSRAKELYETKNNHLGIDENGKYIFVRANSVLTKIQLKEIIYIQALGDYVNIFTNEKRYTVHSTLRGMEEKLAANKFYRLHRSYLVAVDHIDTVEDNTAYVGKHHLPIGEQFKKELLKKLNLV